LPSLPPALPQGLGFALAFLTIFRFPLLEFLCFLCSSVSKGFGVLVAASRAVLKVLFLGPVFIFPVVTFFGSGA